MALKTKNIEFTKELFDRSIKGSPREAIKELIWNACDADAKNIDVIFTSNSLIGSEYITDIYVKDDGHGIAANKIEEYFGKYGCSQKTYTDKSPAGRIYHGKLGQGRYKSLAIGNFLDWDSVFCDERGSFYHSEVHVESGSRMNISFSEIAEKIDATHTGTTVHIHGLLEDRLDQIELMAKPDEMIPELLSTFAPYLLAYTDITVKYNGVVVEPYCQLKKQEEKELIYEEEGTDPIKVKLYAIIWKETQYSKLYICGNNGVVYDEIDYTPLKKASASIYIMGDIFEKMHRDNILSMAYANPAYVFFVEEAKKYARELIVEQENDDAVSEIARIKNEGIYPYDGEPDDDIKKAEREVFDIFAVQINRAVPQLKSSSQQTKKLTYRLMREAINTNPSSIKTILTEVFNLSQQQQNDLAELLTHTSLPEIIDTAKTVSDRLVFLHVLEEMVYNDTIGKEIKERTQFHKILLKELWIFGEKYTLGTSDQSLKNLLKAHINYLGRDELIPDIPPEAMSDLTRIPDICLFQQICPSYENFEHLVIELKRPTLTLTMNELDQIRDYASTVADHAMFDKSRTKWHFILLGKNIDKRVRNALKNQTVGDGNYYNAENVSISVFEWSKIIQDNKLKYEYLRKKLNHQLNNDPNFITDYLHTKHAELFPVKE